MSDVETAERFVRALASRDFDALGETLTEDVRLRGLIPPGPIEDFGPGAVVARLRGWFGTEAAEILELLGSDTEQVVDRVRMRYRFRWRQHADSVPLIFEQVAFCDVEDDRLRVIDLLCSGDRREQTADGGPHRFDAGDLGCADGLSEEFKRRIRAVAVGEVLEVVASDPSAREDLPSLARLLGHHVERVESLDDGRLLMRVERMR